MNLLDIVNQILDQTDDGASERANLLGLPSALVGIDLERLSEHINRHRERMQEQLGHPVHEAVALLDLLNTPDLPYSIDDFCVLRKDAMQDLMQAAIYDKLTGLFSRNIMDTRLREEP